MLSESRGLSNGRERREDIRNIDVWVRMAGNGALIPMNARMIRPSLKNSKLKTQTKLCSKISEV